MHGRFVGVEDGVAVIRYGADHGAAATMLDRNGKREVIQSELSQLLGAPVGVKFLVESDPAAPGSATPQAALATPPPRLVVYRELRAAPAPAPAPPVQQGIRITPELREELKSAEPLIRALIDDLGAEIVKVE
jgi:hypothetical protein